ncbi:hypothetical protein NLJ89_g11806 [Agrocybe chaxingu]|uniref:C2H2-type domain-containing protein n=1 Tax=Agrocybe chaxingu TaxID=84603 RepID=A0A9W8JNH8_9AGAR|nr:hypothetical protein NLJ89_g11806 [Agrocybe chaxingu]
MAFLEHPFLECPVCTRLFGTAQGLNSHLKTAALCRTWGKGKKREIQASVIDDAEDSGDGAPTPLDIPDVNPAHPLPQVSPQELEDALQDLQEQWDVAEGEPYHFVAEEELIEIGEAGPGPSTAQRRNRNQVRVLDEDDDTRVVLKDNSAGTWIRMDDTLHQRWSTLYGHGENTTQGDSSSTVDKAYAPFASEMDWRIARWVIQDGIGHKSFDRLLSIPGVVEKLGLSFKNIHSPFTIRYRNPLEAIKSLWGDPGLASHLVYRPRKIFSHSSQENRIYTEMWTGQWWHAVQSQLPDGATLAPVIIATDKTQLTQFSGGKVAYPVYLTLGNIPKALRRKPSKRACILIGYLPTETTALKVANLAKKEVSKRYQRLFHESMRHILLPLIEAGQTGVEMTGGNGEVRRVFPILACYVADFPEQCLVTCTKYGTCPKCRAKATELQNDIAAEDRTQSWTSSIIEDAATASQTPAQFYKICMSSDVSGSVYEPFWKDFPLANINLSITPDVLHQLYQGVLKHLITWCQTTMTVEELDARVRTLPPAFGVRHFKNGFSVLSQISGPERKHMSRILLGCLIGKMAKTGCPGRME